jgi:hypothetical protein
MRALLTLSILMILIGVAHAFSPATEIIISVPDQQLALIDEPDLFARSD